MELDPVAAIAAVFASAGALARTTRIRRIHALGVPLLVLGWAGLLATIAPASVSSRWLMLLAVGIVVVAAAAMLARSLSRHAHWLLAAGAALLTIRVPVPSGEGTAMLLAPLYVVIALGSVVVMLREFTQLRAGARLLPDRGGATRLLDVGAALLPAAATASLAWTYDRAASTESLAFFLVPFMLAYAVVRALASDSVDLRPAGRALIASGVVVALVGLVQAVTQQVWWNPKVVDANRFRADFRVNSLYWDPNMYGRALVVAALGVVAWLLVAHAARRTLAASAVLLALMVAALWNTYSQSSWFAMAAGLTVIAVLTLPPTPRRWVAAVLVVAVVVGTPLAAGRLAGDDADGRGRVVRIGIALAAERPIQGWGVGAFESAARAREAERGKRDPGLVASHTTPITVFAELGLLGAFTYLTLLASAVVTLLARWRRTSTPASAARALGDVEGAGTGWPIAPIIWATGALLALVAHSMLYAGFFEDPTLWVALAVLASLPLVAPEDEPPAGHLPPDAAKDATPHGDVLRATS